MYAILARRFNERGLVACLWRDWKVFPDLLGTDMDVVVDAVSWPSVPAVLREVVDECGWRIECCIRRGHLHTWLIRSVKGDPLDRESSLQIDLHRALTVSAVPFVDVAGLLSRRRTLRGAQFLDSIDGAVISCLERLIAGFGLKPENLSAFDEAQRNEPERLAGLLRESLGRQHGSSFDPCAPAPGLPRQALMHALRQRPRILTSVLWQKTLDGIAMQVRPPGAMISVSGPDGVGKSTVIELLARRASRRICIGVTLFHTRPFLLPRLAAFLPRRRKVQVLDTRTYERRLSPMKSWLRVAILLMDYNLGYWVKVRPRLVRGELVIFDRYFLDVRVDPLMRGVDLPDSILKRIGKLIPRPHLSIVLAAEPQTLVARKGELDLQEAQTQIGMYRRLAAEYSPGLLIETDGADPPRIAGDIVRRLSAVRPT